MPSSSCSMLPPPFQRSSMTRPSLWRNSPSSFLNLASEGWSIAWMWRYPTRPPESLSTIARRSLTHRSYRSSLKAMLEIGSYLTFQAPSGAGLSLSVSSTLRLSRRPSKAK